MSLGHADSAGTSLPARQRGPGEERPKQPRTRRRAGRKFDQDWGQRPPGGTRISAQNSRLHSQHRVPLQVTARPPQDTPQSHLRGPRSPRPPSLQGPGAGGPGRSWKSLGLQTPGASSTGRSGTGQTSQQAPCPQPDTRGPTPGDTRVPSAQGPSWEMEGLVPEMFTTVSFMPRLQTPEHPAASGHAPTSSMNELTATNTQRRVTISVVPSGGATVRYLT